MNCYWARYLGHRNDRPVFELLSYGLVVGVLQQPAANDL